jgi:hypothetical protein
LRWLEQFSFVLSMVALVGLPIAVGIAISSGIASTT